MIKKGADPTQRNYKDGCNSLHALSRSPEVSLNNKKLFDLFLRQGCDINSFDARGITPLDYAIIFENLTAIKILIKKGVDINKHGKFSMPSIYIAAGSCNRLAFDILYNNNATLTYILNSGNNIIHMMLKKESYREYFYKKILNKHPELLLMKNKDGNTPIDMIKNIKDESIKSSLLSLVKKY